MDISRSRIYPFGGLQLNVNLKGREKNGIVEEDFAKVQEEIIDKLLDWRAPGFSLLDIGALQLEMLFFVIMMDLHGAKGKEET